MSGVLVTEMERIAAEVIHHIACRYNDLWCRCRFTSLLEQFV